jgi:hypothetical protein
MKKVSGSGAKDEIGVGLETGGEATVKRSPGSGNEVGEGMENVTISA